MKRILMVLAVVAMLLAIAAPAFATPPDHARNRICTIKDGVVYDSVGEMMQNLPERDGTTNPKEFVELYPGSFANVGELIFRKC